MGTPTSFVYKQMLLLFGVFLLAALVVGVMVYLRSGKKETPSALLAIKNSGELSNRIATADSDKDGLADWEEQLWKTDPKNPDSDGDGTSDGVEVQSGRNPLQGGNDTMSDSRVAEAWENATGTSSMPNMTAEVAKHLYGNLIAMEQFGTNDTETKKKLILQTAEKMGQGFAPPPFDSSEIRTTDDISAARAERYRQELGAAMKPFQNEQEQNEILLMGKIISTNDPEARQKLDTLLSRYDELIVTLKNMEVPSDAREQHTDLTRAFVGYRFSLEGMEQLHADSLRSFLSAKLFSTELASIQAAGSALGVYFRNKGII